MQADTKPPGHNSGVMRVVMAPLGALVAILLFFMMTLTFVDVMGRYLFNNPLPGAYELSENLLAVCVFAALPLAALGREHVTVSLVDGLFSGAAKAVQQLLVGLFSFIALVGVTWRVWVQADLFVAHGDRTLFLHIPLGAVAYFMAAMAALSAVITITLVARQIFAQVQH